jgi:hypothetical protein
MKTKGLKEDDFRKLSKIIIDYLKEVKEGTQEGVREDYISKVEEIINDVKSR